MAADTALLIACECQTFLGGEGPCRLSAVIPRLTTLAVAVTASFPPPAARDVVVRLPLLFLFGPSVRRFRPPAFLFSVTTMETP